MIQYRYIAIQYIGGVYGFIAAINYTFTGVALADSIGQINI